MATATVRRPLPRVRAPSRAVSVALALGGLVALSCFLRTREFSAAYWIDEGLSWGISSHHFFSIPHVLRQDGSPPLYYLMLHVWMKLFGTSEPATHTLSLIPALATIPLGYWAGRSLFGERAGWFAAVLFAFDSYLTMYAQESRMYTWMALFALLATASFLHAFVFRRRRYLILFALSLALMLYTHNWAFFFIAASLTALAVLVVQSDDRRALLRDGVLAYGGALLLFAPWLPTLFFQIRHTGAPWSTPPSLGTLEKAAPMTLDGQHIAMAIVLAGGSGIAAIVKRRESLERSAAIAGLILFFGTMLWAFLASQFAPAWAYRYFAAFVPPMLLMAGLGLARARTLGLVATALILAFWLPYHSLAHKSIDRWVMHHAAPTLKRGDLVIVTHPESVPVVNYYAPPGLRYATEFGPVRDTGVMNWIDAHARLEKTSVKRDLEPLLASVKPGQHVLLLVPVIDSKGGWDAPWTSLVRRRSRQWVAAMLRDPRFRVTGRFPHLRWNYHPRGLRAIVFTRV